MTMSEVALAVAARTAASVQIGMGKALGDQQMIEMGKAQRRKAEAEYARALARDTSRDRLSSSDRSDAVC
jgi:hypothetical protein